MGFCLYKLCFWLIGIEKYVLSNFGNFGNFHLNRVLILKIRGSTKETCFLSVIKLSHTAYLIWKQQDAYIIGE